MITAISQSRTLATTAPMAPMGTASKDISNIRLSVRKSESLSAASFVCVMFSALTPEPAGQGVNRRDNISYNDTKQLDFWGHQCFDEPRDLAMPIKPPKITKTEYETLAALRHALRQFLRFSEEAARAAGLTPQQHQALLAIKGFPGRDRITISELAERLQIRHHSAVGLADRLVSSRLVARKQDTVDRRQVYLVLTAPGEALLEKLSAAHKEQLRRVSPQIGFMLEQLRG